ncbi:MAG TPA: glycosyltransferase family 4 protein [Pyrinomonadaceae bacterium]|nr:glycosyltransferase family 4 protein [Pyrinomonadaceae bacterium]
MKVLLVGHACGPDRGSESGVTWNFAWQLSQAHEVWVMTDPQFREDIERHLELHPNPNLKFVWVGLPPRWDPRRTPGSDKGIRLHYLFWQRAVLREARLLHSQQNFDVVHHLSWGTISAPPLLWRLPIPFVWGPIGGGQTTPAAFRRYFGFAWGTEVLRTLRVKLATHLPGLRRAVRKSALILSTNPETTRALTAAGARQVRFFPNVGVPEQLMGHTPDQHAFPRKELVILWVGRIIPLKGLPLALEALSQIDRALPLRLRILGDGPLKADMKDLAQSLGVSDRVDFVGAVPWSQMMAHYRDADIFLFTSLRDSSGAVITEALAYHLPILTLNHQGVGAIVPPEAGIKVAVTNPEETVRALAEGLRRLAQSPQLREHMGEAAWVHAQSMGWQQHVEQMSEWYEEVVANHRSNGHYSYAAL